MWAICKAKEEKLYIRFIHKDVLYSYSRIPLTNEGVEKTLSYAPFIPTKQAVDGEIVEWEFDRISDPNKYDKLIMRMNQLAKEYRDTDKFEKVSSKVYISKVSGSSRLVRSKDFSKIHIAKRRNNKNFANSVCISNDLREKFFEDSKRINGIPTNNMYYIYSYNESVFKKWCDIMDKVYEEGAR